MLPQRARWPMTANVFKQTAGLERMLDVLGIDARAAARMEDGKAWFEACSICISCPSARACRHLLDGIERLAEPPAYCPNGRYLRACRRA